MQFQTKVDEFLSLVSSTLESYLQAYKEDWPQDGMEETQFILALCGIITSKLTAVSEIYSQDYDCWFINQASFFFLNYVGLY